MIRFERRAQSVRLFVLKHLGESVGHRIDDLKRLSAYEKRNDGEGYCKVIRPENIFLMPDICNHFHVEICYLAKKS